MLQPITPGVYVEERPANTPGFVQVLSNIPAFMGITARIPASGTNIPIRINSLIDYETNFGKAIYPNNFQIALSNDSGTLKITDLQQSPLAQRAILYYAMQLYFMNGGGPCYVVPMDSATTVNYTNAINTLTSVDEVSLLVLPDASLLLNALDYHHICNTALQHCSNFTNRFVILDVLDTTDGVQQFRNQVVDNLGDGAAYTPYLNTIFSFDYHEDDVQVTIEDTAPISMHKLANTNDTHYRFLKAALASSPKVILPPSAAIAGIYVRMDSAHGVWKAPANVSISGINGTTRTLSESELNTLNVDPVSGKSINAIRSITGRGTLVWGARTLAGNDTEYRYISVRRFLNMVETSVFKSSHFVVFEANDATTWHRVKTMIENYLFNLWKNGALQGSKPTEAFFVQVGLGITMTQADVTNGKIIIQIGLAVNRPAEFIVFSILHRTEDSSQSNTDNTTLKTQATTLMQTSMEWPDLVLNPSTKEQLNEIRNWVSYNRILLNDWEIAEKVRQSYSAIFHGPSGTGKTMSANLIGKSLQRPVYRVNLIHVVSKYIGETEKNLSLLFQQAASNDWILFFDEADALFGKRTSIHDAHDRYANQEVSYLLQRIENHSGLVIFATNHKDNIDEILLRRMDMILEFPMPNQAGRLELWKRNIPAKAELARDIDLDKLAKDHKLTGGTIINVIYYACLQALKKRTNNIELSDILKGIQKELNRQELA